IERFSPRASPCVLRKPNDGSEVPGFEGNNFDGQGLVQPRPWLLGRVSCAFFVAMKRAMLEIVRKRSISRSSRDTRIPNPASSWARNSTKVRESTRPVSIKSVSTDGTSTCSCSAKSRLSWSSRFLKSAMSDFLVLGCQQVEQQAIVRPVVDIVPLPLPPDVLEVQRLEDALRRDVDLDRPGVHDVQAQLGESKR